MKSETETTLAALLGAARTCLAQAGIDDAGLDARLLVEHFSGATRADTIANPERSVDLETVRAIEAALARRAAGEPVHRILGYRDFYGLRLTLSAETLEPRPDTETLVDAVLPFINRTVARQGRCSILDLGAGTGAIALALLSKAPLAIATAVDISDDALATAASNARALGLESRLTVKKSDWFGEISGRYDAIVSNPPYIPSGDIGALQREVRGFDPRLALDGGDDGLGAYRVLAAGAGQHLKGDGIVGIEIGSSQKEDVTKLFVRAGFDLIEAMRDLAGHDRVLVFKPR